MRALFLIYCIIFTIVSTVMLGLTNRKSDPWPGVTAIGCFGIGFLWPILLPILAIGYLMGFILKGLAFLLDLF